MPPLHHLSRRLVASSASPLAVRAPIGWLADSQPAAARHIQTAARSRPNVRTNVESWGAARQQTASGWRVQSHASPVTTSRVAGCVRIQSTHARPHGAASSPKRSNTAPLLGGVFGATVFAYLGAKLQLQKEDEEEENPIKSDGKLELANAEETSKIRLVDVTKHDRDADSQWIIRGTSVYDITDFIGTHPGGEIILRACGGSVDPYWKIFSIHQKQEVYDILQQYHIGEIDERDLDDAGKLNWNVLGDQAENYIIDDPFKHDPERDENLIVRTAKPCNAETPGNLLVDFLTPLRLFFVRNHLWVPQTHESPQSLTVELSDGEEMTLSVDDLKAKFKEYTITATLQCSGNRRAHMSQGAGGKTSGLPWDIGAIGTAEFSGVRLRDVLRHAGCDVDDDCPSPTQCCSEEVDKHVHFMSPSDTYAVSIPLHTALNPQADVLIAWDMNGAPLNRDHGGPLRVIVPGTTAARSVKWLGRISISTDESASQYQQRDYKCFGPNMKQADCTGDDWAAAQAIQETPVQSAITNILRANGDNKTTVTGFAFSGGGRRIVRVDVSADGGKTWKQAELQADKAKGARRWAWTLWKIQWPKDELQPGKEVEFVVKACDESYNTQPQTFDSIWNFRGLLANAWHRQTRAYEDL